MPLYFLIILPLRLTRHGRVRVERYATSEIAQY